MPIIKIPFNEYLLLDKLSASDIVNLSRTPRDFIRGRETRSQRTDSMLMGSALHCFVLEPHLFDQLYVVEPSFMDNGEPVRKMASDGSMRKTREGKMFLEDFRAANKGKEIIPLSMKRDVETMHKAIMSNKKARDLLKGAHCEKIALWNKDEIGCKGQIDAYKDGILIDLKTTSNIDPIAFETDSYRRRYHQKLAWYKEGLEANGIKIDEVYLITVSDDECIVRRFSDDLIERGRTFNDKAIDKYKTCKLRNEWPSWPECLDISIPGFALYDTTDI